MWGCNERQFWHGLPGDEQRAALCPDRQKGEKERDGRESHCWRKTRRFFCFRLGEDFFFFLFFPLQVQSVVRTQLRVLSGAASSVRDPSAGSLGGPGVKVCLLSTFCHVKRKTAKRAFVGKTLHFWNIFRIQVTKARDGRTTGKNENNLRDTVNVPVVHWRICSSLLGPAGVKKGCFGTN